MTEIRQARRRRQLRARTRIGLTALGLLLVPFAGLQPAGAVAVHVDNPFVGATWYVNPDYTAKADAQAAQTGNATLAANMRTVGRQPTAVWMDRIAAISGSSTSRGLAAHLDTALAQQQGSTPVIVMIVIYDLPGRDCAALASNGELPATDAGLNRYRTEYIDPIAATMAQAKYETLRIVAVIEPDSLPNLVTNTSVAACNTAAPYYRAGVAYALDKLHAIAHVYTYVDAAHAGWLGWPNNASGTASEFARVANMTVARFASIDGFVTNTANTTPLKEPFFQGTTTVNGQQVMSHGFYEWNPDVDEAAFSADMHSRLVSAGFPSTVGMLIDTSRNGWGGSERPTAASTSTDLNTFVPQSKVDKRPHRGAWCNQNGAGIGERPTATPSGYPNSHLDAFVWVKPPGESDGASSDIPNDEGKRFDRMCDPTYVAPNLGNRPTNALPNAPLSGQWFAAQFAQLVQNAFPTFGSSSGDTTPPSAPSGLASSSVTSSSVALSWTAATDNIGVAGYDILRAPGASGGSFAVVGTSTTPSFTNAGLTAATTYRFQVRARDAAGNVSVVSNTVTATTGAATGDTSPPSAPGGLASSSVTSSSVALSWTPSTDNVGVTGYDVLRAPGASGGSFAVVGTSTGTSFTNTGLTASTTYRFQVRARDSAGNVSAVSNTVVVTTPVSGGGGAAGGCTAAYRIVNQWPGGFQAEVVVTNGSVASTSWTVSWTFANGQTITNIWNGADTASGASHSVRNLSYNGGLGPNASTSFGFNGTWNATNSIPTPTCARS